MDIFFIGIGSLLILAIIAAIATKLTKKKEGEPDVVMPTSGDCSSCDGTDDKCEQVCMMEAAVKGVEYYDYTMQPHEVKGWNRSLILREINLPNQIKDELITMIEG